MNMQTNLKQKKLDHIAQKYHLNKFVKDKYFDNKFQSIFAHWLLQNVKFQSVLEMGIGESNITKILIRQKKNIDIVEGSKKLIENARLKYKNKINFHHSLFEDFIPKKKYDLILATNILEHVKNPNLILKLLHKWCSKNTFVAITVPNSESIHRRLAVHMGLQKRQDSLSPRDLIVGHQRVYSSKKITKQIKKNHFRILKKAGFLLKILSNEQLLKLNKNLTEALYKISDDLSPELMADLAFIVKKK
jgi:2-polyprenyl-3-methyl-5-hydroxy-6-metoxy-1,4-benzoquinol methylase